MEDGERHVHTGGPECPELAVKSGLTWDFFAVHGKEAVAALESGACRRAFRGDADHDDAVVDLGRKHPEPGPRRLVDAAEFAQIVEHRLEQIDRHDHVDMLGLSLSLAF